MSSTGPSRIEAARLRISIRTKLATVTAALTALILCLFAVVVGAVVEQRIKANFDDDLTATAVDLQDRIGPPTLLPDGSLSLDGDPIRGAAAGGALIRIVDARTGYVAFPKGARQLVPPGVEGVVDIGGYHVVSRPLVRSVRGDGQLFKAPNGALAADAIAYLQYGKSEASTAVTINRVRTFLALGVIGGTILAFLGGLLVAKRAMGPIAGLTRAAREVARTRDPDITLPKPIANDEVADLAFTLEDMLAELSAARAETEASLGRQREFVADASHELRTPLTSILANLELLETELEGEQREMATSALRSSRRMRRLVADLLLLARADAGRQAPMRPVDLSAIVREAASEALALADDHPLSLDVPAPIPVRGAEDDLHRVVANLVENAFIHTPAGTPVTVSVRRQGESAVIEVSDRGPGVPEEMRERIFNRFTRGVANPSTRGSGLGLSIVRAVAQAHNGTVTLSEAEGGGARFTVTLPLSGEAAVAPQTSTTTGSTIGRRRSRS